MHSGWRSYERQRKPGTQGEYPSASKAGRARRVAGLARRGYKGSGINQRLPGKIPETNSARIGNVVLGAGTVLVFVGTFLWGMSFASVVLAGTILIWIVRSLLAYSSVLMGLVDGALCLLSLGVAASVFGTAGGLFWAIWCFFLIQSLFTLIPERPGRSHSEPAPEGTKIHIFSEAHENAEAALRELARQASLR